jgi:ABC-type transport system substrate-binding protein
MATNAVQEFPVESAPRARTVVDGQVWTGSGAYANADHRGGILVWAGPGDDLDGFDPAGGSFPTYRNLARVVYDGLVANRLSGGRAPFGLVPDVATRLPELSDGGRTYIFSIRPNIRYSTGAIVLPSESCAEWNARCTRTPAATSPWTRSSARLVHGEGRRRAPL